MLGSWATIHPPALDHDTMVCIVTGMAGYAAKGATTRPGKATTQSSNAATRPRGRHDTTGSAHMRGLAGCECHNTKYFIVTGERGLASRECVMIQSIVS